MALSPVPKDEAQRIAKLRAYQILDTPPEVEFDVTTRVASRLFSSPIALVALMDSDRLWFKSKHGLELEQLDREVAFCAHAIMRPDQLMIIDDLSKDARFADNPLVKEGGPCLRFYAGAPLCTSDGTVLGTLAVLDGVPRSFDAEQRALLRDLAVSVITAIENRQHTTELRQIATTDHLTGLANRIQFEKILSTELSQAKRTHASVSILYMDLDQFKPINDTLGHAAGDEVLAEVASRMRKQLRDGETASRMGGDEFAVTLRAGSDAESAIVLAERIARAISQPMRLSGGQEVSVSMSVGIATCRGKDLPVGELIQRADRALYQAKKLENRRWSVFDLDGPMSHHEPESAVGQLTESNQNTEKCNACTEGGQRPFPFTMAFQPIISIASGEVYAYEALVRGLDGEGAAEVMGQVTRHNRYAFDQSCRRTAIELATQLGILNTSACLSINFISGAVYEPESCVRATLKAAKRAGLPTDRIIFEVTESEEVRDPLHLAKIFKVYQRHGLLTAIDGFGVGLSGLNMLADFQPRIIKLDRELIHGIDTSVTRNAIVRGMLNIFRELSITPIAKGVETLGEFRALQAMGIDLFQGYLFGQPELESFPKAVIPA